MSLHHISKQNLHKQKNPVGFAYPQGVLGRDVNLAVHRLLDTIGRELAMKDGPKQLELGHADHLEDVRADGISVLLQEP